MRVILFFFFFNDTATTEIYTLSLHDALPIFHERASVRARGGRARACRCSALSASKCGGGGLRGPFRLHAADGGIRDRKSTRLNSSHANISYAVFCLKKKKNSQTSITIMYVSI